MASGRILVTGSSGTVGALLVRELRTRGFTVVGADLAHTEWGHSHSISQERRTTHAARVDIGEFRQVTRLWETLGPFEFVFHCAAEFGRWNGEDYYEQLWRTNAVGTKNLIRMQEQERFRMIFLSSSEVYGDWAGIMSEEVPDLHAIRLLNDYALSKRVNEEQIRNATAQAGTETVVVRLFNTYGPGEYYSPYRSVNCRFAYAALHGLPVRVHLGHSRSSTFLNDVIAALANIPGAFNPGAIYNLGSNNRHTIQELAEITWELAGADSKLITLIDEPEILTTRDKIVNADRAVREIGFAPGTDLREGIGETLDWMKAVYHVTP